MNTIAIVAAMDRELAPLVQDWQSRQLRHDGRNFCTHEHENLVTVAGGIGRAAATRAAQALVAHYRPAILVSAGLAGALHADLKVGSLFIPNVVIDSSTSAEYRADRGSGILLTATEILSRSSKQRMATRFQAAAVDMEAAAVAQVARQEGIGFRCVKAISDDLSFEMPPLNQFVDEEGRLQTAKLALWAALHPWQWSRIMRLGRNAGIASKALCDWLARAGTGLGVEPESAETPGKATKVLDV